MPKKKIKEIFIGSNNKGKLKEIADLLPKNLKIYSNLDFKIKSPRETGISFQENSLLKVFWIAFRKAPPTPKAISASERANVSTLSNALLQSPI